MKYSQYILQKMLFIHTLNDSHLNIQYFVIHNSELFLFMFNYMRNFRNIY